MLAISSKNNIWDVKECFKKLPDLSIKLNQFSSIKINWEPKFKNIREIATELNIGLDSMVFIDDSKFERHQMKKFNPEVNVLEFPSSPLEIVNTIENSCF